MIKVGIIGCGAIARAEHIPGLLALPARCQIAALYDPSESAIEQTRALVPDAPSFATVEELLATPGLDAVVVATPNLAHAEPTIAALRAGKHVLVEKPMAVASQDAQRMEAAGQEAGKILQVGLNFRFHGVTRFLDDFIANGHMGDVQYARAKCLRRRGVPNWGGFIDKSVNGGGPLIDLGVHILDLTLHLMGYPTPVSVSGVAFDTLGKDPAVGNFFGPYDRSKFTVEDFAVGFIRFANGACVTLESSFMSNGEGDPYETQLYGTKAGALVRPVGDPPLQIFKELDGQFFTMSPARVPNVPRTHHAEVEAFIAAIEDGKPSPVPGREGVMLTQILEAIYESAASGREVRLG